MTEDNMNCIDYLQQKVDELTVSLYKGDGCRNISCRKKYIVEKSC